MIERIKTHYHKIIIVTLLIIIILINIHPNKYIMGLDNMSPWFNYTSIFEKSFSNNAQLFQSFFPMLLISPVFELLKLINIPIWVINQGYIFFNLVLGVLGVARLSQLFTKYINKKDEKLGYILGGTLYIFSLVTIWVFNQSNFYILSAYGSVPWLIIFLYRILKRERIGVWDSIFLGTLLILFLQSSVNIASFLIYSFSIVIISVVLIKSAQLELDLKRLITIVLIFLVSWLTIQQTALLVTGNNQFVITNLTNHYINLNNNPISEKITEDLRASSYLRNSLGNNVRFSNSWVETHDNRGELLFEYKDLYTKSILSFLGLLPFIISLSSFIIISSLRKRERLSKIHIIAFLGLLAMSTPILRMTEEIPIIGDILRWPGSKFWILTGITIPVIAAVTLLNYYKKVIVSIIIILVMGAYSFPLFTGNLFAKQLVVEIPQAYEQLDVNLDSNSKYYYLPFPESSYFYSYNFGYFGSDFVGYLTKGDYKTRGVISYFDNYDEYQNIERYLTTCNKGNHTEKIKVILDTNLTNFEAEKYTTCLKANFNLISNSGGIEIYEER